MTEARQVLLQHMERCSTYINLIEMFLQAERNTQVMPYKLLKSEYAQDNKLVLYIQHVNLQRCTVVVSSDESLFVVNVFKENTPIVTNIRCGQDDLQSVVLSCIEFVSLAR